MRRFLLVLCVLLASVPGTARASLTLQIGAAEDEGRNADPAVAQAKIDLAKAAGFDAIRVTAIWAPRESAVPPDQLAALQAVSAAAAVDGVTIWTTVMPYGSKTTPLTVTARRQFASFSADLVRRVPAIPYVIVGNEPNLNRYWLPQYAPDGTDAAAPAYEKLLAQTYDAIKKVNKNTFVVGGSVSPHGSDDPTNPRQTHSPTAKTRPSPRKRRIRRRRRSASRTTTSSSACSARRSTGRDSSARRCRSCTTSTASSRSSRPRSSICTTAASPRRRSP